tara:strand:+ start:344 stop:5311 length:4968 start_codon:yes stop_codon:yes gene_type:complete
MGCRIDRNEKGNITSVKNRFGQESELFNQINSLIENGNHEDIAYAAYLKATGDAKNIGILQEPALVNNIVQNVLEDVSEDFTKWDNIAKNLKFKEANNELASSLFYFLDRAGIKVETVETLKNNAGEDINAVGLANLTNRTIQLAEGADISTMTEETAHFVVEILRADNNPLFKSMYNLIENYAEFKKIIDPNGFYYQKYNGDIDLLKREAIAKVITKHLINGAVENETKEKLSRLQRWWDRVMKFIQKLLGDTKTDPFKESAMRLFNKDLQTVLKTDPARAEVSGVFYQEDAQKSILEKLAEDKANYETQEIDISKVSEADLKKYFKRISKDKETIQRYVAVSGPYKGKILKIRGSDKTGEIFAKSYVGYTSESEKALNQHNQTVRMAMGTKGHLVMEKLIDLNFHNKGSIGEIAASVGSAMKLEHVKRLDKSIKTLKKTIIAQQNQINKDTGTKGSFTVLTEQFVANEKAGVGGTLDLVAIFSDGSASIYDYKFKSANAQYSKANRGRLTITGDMFTTSLEGYDWQISHYRDALEQKYGVTKIRQSRIVPVAVRYVSENGKLDNSLTALEVWSDIGKPEDDKGIDAKTMDWLRPIPVAQETTDDKQVNRLIEKEMERLKALVVARKNAPYKDKAALDVRINTSSQIVRDLQITKNVSTGLTELFRLQTIAERGIGVEDEYITDENGVEILNPDYLSEKQLRDLYNELTHFRGFTELHEVSKKIRNISNKKTQEKKVKELESASQKVGATIQALREEMVSRMDRKAKKLGINNFTYNRAQSKVNTYINVSAQSNPYSRYVTRILDSANALKIKFEEKLAREIEEHEALMREYAQENNMSVREAYESKIINPNTHNLVAKFDSSFYTTRQDRIDKGDFKWMKDHHVINKERFNRDYPEWKKREFNRIEQELKGRPEAIKTAKKKWIKEYDLNNSEQAWLGRGRYWLNIDDKKPEVRKYITQEFKDIQNDSRLKRFYDFHVKKIREFEDRFGKKLGHNYVGWITKSSIDSLLEAGNKGEAFISSITDRFKSKGHDVNEYGIKDGTGTPIRHIPRMYTTPLTKFDEDGNEVVDPTLKSTELGRSLYMLGQASFEYEMLREIEDEVLLIEMILKESMIDEVFEDQKGRSVSKGFGRIHKTFNTAQTNAANFTDVIDLALYNRNLKTKDIIVGENISLNKSAVAAKTFHSVGALGLKLPVALGALGAGTIGLHIQGAKGLDFTNKDVRFAEKAFISRDPKLRAIMEYFQLAVLDVSKRRGEMLSTTVRAKYMTGDRWFEFLAQADMVVDAVLGVALAKSHGVDKDGNLKRLSELPEGSKSVYDSIELTDNENYTFSGAQQKYNVKFEGETPNAFSNFRARHGILSTKVKGTASPEQLNTAGMTLINRFFLHYRSWLPGLALERFGVTRYDYILERFDQGTWRGFWGNFGPDQEFDDFKQLVTAEFALHEYFGAAIADIGRIALDISTFGMTNAHKIKEGKARQEFELHLADRAGDPDFEVKGKTEEQIEQMFQDFLKMKRGNLRGALAELRAVILLGMTLMAMGGDWDDDGKIDMRQSWLGRKMHNIFGRIYRETAVFWDPTELTGPRSTGIPLLGLTQDGIKLVNNSADELFDRIMGRQGVEKDDRVEAFYYTFKLSPGLSGLAKALEIYPQHKQSRT